MRISSKSNYAIKALLNLVASYELKTPVQLQDISRKQNIPLKFLVHIMLQLKSMNMVESARGKNGGYFLVRPPKDITLGEIMDAFQGAAFKTHVFEEKLEGGSSRNLNFVLGRVLEKVDMAVSEILHGVTLRDLAAETQRIDEVVNYSI